MPDPIEGNEPNPKPAETPMRPEGLPESYWDGTKNALNIEAITKDATELGTLRTFKTEAETKAGARITKPEDVKLDLPKDFALPENLKWIADPKDPLAIGITKLATERGWSQEDVSALTGFWAGLMIEEHKAHQAEASALKTALGDGAEQRIAAVNTFAAAPANKKYGWLNNLGIKDRVEAGEQLIALTAGTQMRGQSQPLNGRDTELSKKPGQAGFGREALEAANAPKQ